MDASERAPGIAGALKFSQGPMPSKSGKSNAVTKAYEGYTITLKGTPEFVDATEKLLTIISATATGKKTLGRMKNTGKSLTITEFNGDNSFAQFGSGTFHDLVAASSSKKQAYTADGKWAYWKDPKTGECSWKKTPQPGMFPAMGAGTGTDVELKLNPTLSLHDKDNPKTEVPPDAILLHEMVHGLHFMEGTADFTPIPHPLAPPPMQGWDNQEEKTTILDGDPSEATYLRDTGKDYHRTSHGSDDYGRTNSGATTTKTNPP
jgi:hypothetical protein